MAIDTIKLYKEAKVKKETELKRELTKYERLELLDKITTDAFDGVKIPDEEISDLEINGLKD